MAENSWAERRRRMVKCKIHGLHFDPEMSTGCTLCLRDAAKAQRPTRPPQLVLILLCLLGMAAILLYISGQDTTAGNIDLGIASDPAAAVPKLDPEPFRSAFEALETALFLTPLDETEDLLIVSSNIRSATDELSSVILRDEPVHGLTAADQIARMGQAVPLDQVVVADIQLARNQWRGIRRQRFLPADWFSEPSAIAARPEASASEYSEVASDIRVLIEDGATQIEALSAPSGIPGEDDPAFRWQTFARDWQDQLDSLESRLPSRPGAGANSELLIAIQDLEQAIRLARAIASSPQPPSATDNRFDDAVNAALSAQQGFDNLQ